MTINTSTSTTTRTTTLPVPASSSSSPQHRPPRQDNSYPLHAPRSQVLGRNHWWIAQRWYQTGRNDSFKVGSVDGKKESPLHTYTYNAFKVNGIINCEHKTGKESENWYVTESSQCSSYHSMCNISTSPKRSKSTRNTRLQNIRGTASS